jgi:hypothetical protein
MATITTLSNSVGAATQPSRSIRPMPYVVENTTQIKSKNWFPSSLKSIRNMTSSKSRSTFLFVTLRQLRNWFLTALQSMTVSSYSAKVSEVKKVLKVSNLS